MAAGDDGAPPGQKEFYEAIDKAAKVAAEDPAVTSPATAGSSPAPGQAMTEEYNNQVAKNMAAFRMMRWIAFLLIGATCAVFLMALGYFVVALLYKNSFIAALSATPAHWGWHALVFVCALMVLLAVVPMTLGLALIRMVSNSRDDGRDEIPVPSSQLIKFLGMCMKGGSSR